MKEFADQICRESIAFSDVIVACKYLLKHSDKALKEKDYIYNRISAFNIDKFDIGYFPNDDNLHLLTDLIGENVLKELRLIYKWQAHDRSHILNSLRGIFNIHNIIFPFKDEYGNIIALAGRTLLSEDEQIRANTSKYKNTYFNKTLHLFGLYQAKRAIRKKGYVIIVEGQIDCINCHSYGIHNVVALCCASLSRFQFYLLKKLTNKIYLLLDNDLAGKRSEQKIMDRYSRYADINKIHLPDKYKDVDEYLYKSDLHDIFNI